MCYEDVIKMPNGLITFIINGLFTIDLHSIDITTPVAAMQI